LAVFAVVVADPGPNQVLHVVEEAVADVGHVAGGLRHPRLVRLTRDPGDLHGAGLELHDEEDDLADQSAKGQHFDGERVGRRETVPVSRE
jgi:hypothetical protein